MRSFLLLWICLFWCGGSALRSCTLCDVKGSQGCCQVYDKNHTCFTPSGARFDLNQMVLTVDGTYALTFPAQYQTTQKAFPPPGFQARTFLHIINNMSTLQKPAMVTQKDQSYENNNCYHDCGAKGIVDSYCCLYPYQFWPACPFPQGYQPPDDYVMFLTGSELTKDQCSSTDAVDNHYVYTLINNCSQDLAYLHLTMCSFTGATIYPQVFTYQTLPQTDWTGTYSVACETCTCDGFRCRDSCGDEGCGTCPEGSYCSSDGRSCICIPQCTGKQCGNDTCGGSCGNCTFEQHCSNYQCLSNQTNSNHHRYQLTNVWLTVCLFTLLVIFCLCVLYWNRKKRLEEEEERDRQFLIET